MINDCAFVTSRAGDRVDLLLPDDLRIPEDAHQGLRIRQLRHAEQEARCFNRIDGDGQGVG